MVPEFLILAVPGIQAAAGTSAAGPAYQPVTPPPPGTRLWTRSDFPEERTDAAASGDAPTPPSAGPKFLGAANYPKEALRRGEQGRTLNGLTIGTDGRVARCWTIESSGSAVLDKESCRVAVTRMRWTLAKDDAGRHVASEIRFPIRWVLPGR